MESNSFVNSLPPKTAFIGGIVTAILLLGTLGFIVLGACMLSGSCGAGGSAAPSGYVAPTAPPTGMPDDEFVGPIPPVTDDDHVLGDRNAPVTLVEYSDFECPFCSRFFPTVKQIAAEYPRQVRIVYRHFPLSFHPQAEPAGAASECAAEQGKFWEFHDKLFENQTMLSTAYYSQAARELGLNMQRFDDCVSSGRMLAKVREQYQGGVGAGVNGTPGSFIIAADGSVTPIRGALPYENVKPMIDAALAR